jgi:hypothetical protein
MKSPAIGADGTIYVTAHDGNLYAVNADGTQKWVFQTSGDFAPYNLYKGCDKVGIKYGRFTSGGFVFHDLRHTAKTNMRKAGIDRNLRMFIFGHSDGNDMDYRYDTIDNSDLLAAVDQLEMFLQDVDQIVDHGQKNSHVAMASNDVINCFYFGAEGETRTPTRIPGLDPESNK